MRRLIFFFFFFNDTATTEIYTLSLHDALPISPVPPATVVVAPPLTTPPPSSPHARALLVKDRTVIARIDRKSTRLNSSHSQISYAVFCLKKKKKPISSNLLDVQHTAVARQYIH